jgi:hypothetical protein
LGNGVVIQIPPKRNPFGPAPPLLAGPLSVDIANVPDGTGLIDLSHEPVRWNDPVE